MKRISPAEMIGKEFGRLTVTGMAPASNRGTPRWTCRCRCGVVRSVDQGNLRSGHTVSCGCIRKEIVDLGTHSSPPTKPGDRYVRLLVLERAGSDRWGDRVWKCRCDCGKEKLISQGRMRSGDTQSCGCLNREMNAASVSKRNTTHGHWKGGESSPTWGAWFSMRQRCSRENHHAWKDYGGRGIAVCERWEIFENFLADMGECPEGLTLDRYPDKNGNYEPGNCRWATSTEQNRNRRTNRMITFNGETRCLAEWAELKGLSWTALASRLDNEWDLEQALNTPLRAFNRWKRRPQAVS